MGRGAPAGAEMGALLSGDRRSVTRHLYVPLGVVIGSDPGVACLCSGLFAPGGFSFPERPWRWLFPSRGPVVFPVISYSLKSL